MFKSVFLLSSQHQAVVINAFHRIIIILIFILFLNDTKRKKKNHVFKIQKLQHVYFEKLGYILGFCMET